MKIRYQILCPICVVKGKEHQLELDTDKDGVFCAEGHKFDSLDAAESYDPLAAPAEPARETPAEEPTPTPKEAPTPAVEAETNGNGASAASALEPVPEIDLKDPMQEITSAQTETEFQRAVQAAPARKFVPPPPKKLPGGMLLMTVKIPDQHVSGLTAEAENQKETVQEFFQRMVLFGLDAGWFF